MTAPFSPLGQNTAVASTNATCMALPTNQSIAPLRNQGDLMRIENQEQPFHPIYSYAVVTDAVEGLILVNVNTLTDGDPLNNFLERAVTWNENNVLAGARHITLGGRFAYVAADAGMVIVDLDDPLHPKLAAVVPLPGVRASALQFRYLFALDGARPHRHRRHRSVQAAPRRVGAGSARRCAAPLPRAHLRVRRGRQGGTRHRRHRAARGARRCT